MGCHGHKRNGNDVLIFQAMKVGEDSKECIKCHMPYIDGPVEKMNKRSRMKHRSHYFAGIHDSEMREKGLGIAIGAEGDTLKITLENKMGHPLIIQPARMKYLSLKVVRDGKVIWKNHDKSPREDRQGTFVTDFADADGKPVAIPYFAKKRAFVNNIEAKSVKNLTYKVPTLHKDDRIVAEMYVIPAKPSCAAAVSLDDDSFMQPLLMKRVEKTIP